MRRTPSVVLTVAVLVVSTLLLVPTRALATDGVKLGVGGDFLSVNNKLQQGFTQFG